MITFTPLTPADEPLLLDWLQRPHVTQWWNDGDDTLEKVAAHYSDDTHPRFLMCQDATPIGYIQYYLLADGAAGIDLFIGEESLIDRGVGTAALHAFIALVIARHDPPYFIIDPSPDNQRAIRCYEKAGFHYYATEIDEKGQPTYMMRLERRM